MAVIGLICRNCHRYTPVKTYGDPAEVCAECAAPLFAAPATKAPNLNRFGYSAHPTLSAALDTVTRQH